MADVAVDSARSPAHVRRGFGATGWRIILVSMLMYFAYAGWSVDGLNVFASALADRHGWDPGRLLTLVAPGSLMGVVGSALFGQLIMRWGARRTMALCLVGMSLAVFAFGRMDALWQFLLVFMGINLFGAGFGFIAPGTLVSHWFPRRKGMALAIATCGFPLSTALFVPLVARQIRLQGIGPTSTTWALFFVGAALLAWWAVRDTPEEAGCRPDNESPTAPAAASIGGYESPLSLRRLLADRDIWLLGVGWGCLWMVTIGVVVQLVPRLQTLGYSQEGAIGLLSAAALCAVPGSLLWGFLDQRFGTRVASALYGGMYLVTLALLASSAQGPLAVVAIVITVGLGLSGIKSLLTSMVVSVYGRHDFSAAYRVVIPLAVIVRTACFPIMGLALSGTRSLTPAYVAFMGVDLLALLLVGLSPRTCKGYVPDAAHERTPGDHCNA